MQTINDRGPLAPRQTAARWRQRTLAARPPRIAMALLILAIPVHLLVPAPALPTSTVAAILVAGAGFGLMIRAWWLFRIENAPICPTDEPVLLLTGDVFGLSRNPMYLGMTMMLAATGIYAGGWPFYAAAALFALLLDRVFIP